MEETREDIEELKEELEKSEKAKDEQEAAQLAAGKAGKHYKIIARPPPDSDEEPVLTPAAEDTKQPSEEGADKEEVEAEVHALLLDSLPTRTNSLAVL